MICCCRGHRFGGAQQQARAPLLGGRLPRAQQRAAASSLDQFLLMLHLPRVPDIWYQGGMDQFFNHIKVSSGVDYRFLTGDNNKNIYKKWSRGNIHIFSNVFYFHLVTVFPDFEARTRGPASGTSWILNLLPDFFLQRCSHGGGGHRYTTIIFGDVRNLRAAIPRGRRRFLSWSWLFTSV